MTYQDDDEITITYRTLKQAQREAFELGVETARKDVINAHVIAPTLAQIEQIADLEISITRCTQTEGAGSDIHCDVFSDSDVTSYTISPMGGVTIERRDFEPGSGWECVTCEPERCFSCDYLENTLIEYDHDGEIVKLCQDCHPDSKPDECSECGTRVGYYYTKEDDESSKICKNCYGI